MHNEGQGLCLLTKAMYARFHKCYGMRVNIDGNAVEISEYCMFVLIMLYNICLIVL